MNDWVDGERDEEKVDTFSKMFVCVGSKYYIQLLTPRRKKISQKEVQQHL